MIYYDEMSSQGLEGAGGVVERIKVNYMFPNISGHSEVSGYKTYTGYQQTCSVSAQYSLFTYVLYFERFLF